MIKKIFNKLFGKKEAISFKQGFDLTDMPVITLYQGEKKFNFLLDTGSNNSAISKHVIDQFEHTPIKEKTTTVFGIEGKISSAPISKVTLSYKDKSYTYDYIINDLEAAFNQIKVETGVTLHGIIGSRFFNQYRYVLDFAELIAYSKA